MIGTTLRRYQPERRYIVGDKETEGVNLFYSRPWQIAYIIADSKTIHESVAEYIWWPDLDVSKEAAAKTNFNYVVYKEQAQPPQKVHDRFAERLHDPSIADVVGHNFFFDGYMFNTLRRCIGLPPDWSWLPKLCDTDALSRGYRKGLQPDMSNFVAWQYKMQSIRDSKLKTKLGQMCGEFGIEFSESEAHRADYDVSKTRLLFEQLKWKMEI